MRDIRISIAAIVTILICVGIVMIYSSSGIFAMQEQGDSLYFLKRHLVFLIGGTGLTFAAMAIDYRDLQKYAKPLLVIAIVMLVLVLIPGIGKASFGARRWFKIGSIYFQPSEFAKLVMLICVADFLTRKQNKIKDFFQGFLPVVMVVGAVCLLILKQPDLGSTVLISVVVFLMMFIAGAR